MTFDAKERTDVGLWVASPGCIQVVVIWVSSLLKICNWDICKSAADTIVGAAVFSFAGSSSLYQYYLKYYLKSLIKWVVVSN